MPRQTSAHRRGAAAVVACLATGLAGTVGVVPAAQGEPKPTSSLYLVTLEGAGTAARGAVDGAAAAPQMLRAQDELLALVDAEAPVYRWTTALNGFAVELDADQATHLAGDPRVALVEENRIRPLTAVDHGVNGARTASSARTTTASVAGTRERGGGVVVGFVDTGIDPDSRAFSAVTSLGPLPPRFDGACDDAPDDPGWDAGDCDTKVVAAQHYVAGFGEDRLRVNAVLSPADTDGHGTAVASVAAGTGDVPVEVGGHRLGRFSGVAPRARVAAYKACWSAPDPKDDGCATADLVAAVDRATADRVDVLNLSVGGPSTIDTVELALLGAAEAGIVVTAAAGNEGDDDYAAHPSPWVVTVGATTGAERIGAVEAQGGPTLRGAMAATGPVGPAPLVLAAHAAAPGVRVADARVCAPGSLDAGVVAGAVVVCERGRVARLEKSSTVDLADGVGMVLVNTGRRSTDADLHAVPTVHLPVDEGRRLLAWARATEQPRVRLVARGVDARPARVAPFSSSGDPAARVLKPDLVAEGTSVTAAVPGGWDVVSGTSVAAARVSGLAAVLLGRPGATPGRVRSALLTTAHPLADTGLSAGAGEAVLHPTPRLVVAVPARHYRQWLTGDRATVNQPHLLLSNGVHRGRRTLTNVGRRPVSLSASVEGLEGAAVVRPATAVLRPGASLRFTVRAEGLPRRTDDGAVVWRTGAGRETRIAVVVTR